MSSTNHCIGDDDLNHKPRSTFTKKETTELWRNVTRRTIRRRLVYLTIFKNFLISCGCFLKIKLFVTSLMFSDLNYFIWTETFKKSRIVAMMRILSGIDNSQKLLEENMFTLKIA